MMIWLLLITLLDTAVFDIGPQSQCPEDFTLVGVWDLRSARAPARLVIRENGAGYIRDQVEAIPFAYRLDLSRDPIWFDLQFRDATIDSWETLLRCESRSDGTVLKWVLRPEDGTRPVWPRDEGSAPAGVSVIGLWRVEQADSLP